jgi:hypothetical protein
VSLSALKCTRLDIQPRRLEFEPGASRSRTVDDATQDHPDRPCLTLAEYVGRPRLIRVTLLDPVTPLKSVTSPVTIVGVDPLLSNLLSGFVGAVVGAVVAAYLADRTARGLQRNDREHCAVSGAARKYHLPQAQRTNR